MSTQSKHQQMYNTALGLIITDIVSCFKAVSFVADFEIALRNALVDEFSEAIELGYDSRWKQADTDRLKSNHVPHHLIKQLMSQQKEGGLIDLLMVLKYDKIPKGTYIRSEMDGSSGTMTHQQ